MTLHQDVAGDSGFRAAGGREMVAIRAGISLGGSEASQQRGAAVHWSRVEELLEDVRRAIASNPEATRSAALRLARLFTDSIVLETPAARGGLAPWQKRKVNGYLSAHLNRSLRIEELAEQVALSVSHFCRAFRTTFGTSPHTHIVRSRVELAKRLMLGSDDSLSQIACACGFADQSHLTKLFRRYVGATPHAWRRSHMSEVQPMGSQI